ncbi:MAG: flagellar hook assembly protein FlgD [Deltaproteobacteria bacterium]|nr:flagellar hook assembly protein FlgD [Deltaproteobacteria bacterium]
MSAVSSLDSSLLYKEQSLTTVGDSSLDSEDFMNLLITQLQNQDPMDPMDTSDMVAQVAQLSNMEATQEMAVNMEKLLDYQVSQNNLQLLSLLGNDVTVSSNVVAVNEGSPGSGEFTLSAAVESCRVDIYNSSGNVVRTINAGQLEGDTLYELEWDGTNSGGTAVADGLYLFEVTGLTAEGEEVEVEYQTTGKVTGLDYQSGSAVLTLDNAIPVEVGSVLKVNDATNDAG